MDMIQLIKRQLIDAQLTHGTVVDIGAYDGKNVLASHKAWPGFTYHAIEAHPLIYKELRRRVDHVANIHAYNYAIANKDGVGKLYCPEGRDKHNRICQGGSLNIEWAQRKADYCERALAEYEVLTLTLQSFCRKYKIHHINLLKMNCEGGEFDIFTDRTSWPLLAACDIIYLHLHGKSARFTSTAYNEMKRYINWLLNEWEFKIVYGPDLSDIEKFPPSHVPQIWRH